ncbi:MAG: peptidylprolyl isomerase [Bacteroidota bacterium]|nr:peptidylprolyl isomerase [Bacteroidota bacterium]
MRNIKNIVWIIGFFLISCGSSDNKKAQKSAEIEKEQSTTGFAEISSSIFNIETFENNRILESGMGFFIAPDIAVTRLSYFQSANKAAVEPFDENNKYQVAGFLGFDRVNDLILIKMEGFQRTPVELLDSILPDKEKTVYLSKPTTNVVPLHEGVVINYSNMLGAKLYKITNQLRSKSGGNPVFDANRKCIGLAFMQIVDFDTHTYVIPSIFISDLLKKAGNVQPLSELNSPATDNSALAYNKIKGLLIETDLGNIRIKLSDKTPQYRDNFIKLVRENYFDDLLFHRVIKGFCVQSGAADTRYATADDVVGWKGPGYTLPAHIVPGMYHKRGVIGSPRKPDTENMRKRSDGSQFYIVTGRIYNDIELDELEKENNHTFTEEQRNVYKTIGGAPHLDGTYTIFGEVAEGMEIADRISNVEVSSDFRPKKDIRVKKIRILE